MMRNVWHVSRTIYRPPNTTHSVPRSDHVDVLRSGYAYPLSALFATPPSLHTRRRETPHLGWPYAAHLWSTDSLLRFWHSHMAAAAVLLTMLRAVALQLLLLPQVPLLLLLEAP